MRDPRPLTSAREDTHSAVHNCGLQLSSAVLVAPGAPPDSRRVSRGVGSRDALSPRDAISSSPLVDQVPPATRTRALHSACRCQLLPVSGCG